jgi:hypothetical protein
MWRSSSPSVTYHHKLHCRIFVKIVSTNGRTFLNSVNEVLTALREFLDWSEFSSVQNDSIWCRWVANDFSENRLVQAMNLFVFCWPCITVYQCSETNVMHFLFNLLRIKGLYLFRALLAHPQEALNKRHLVYACVLCQLAAPGFYLFRALLAHPQEALPNDTWYIPCVLCQLAAPGMECGAAN